MIAVTAGRRAIAAARAGEARVALARCVLCEHRCGVDRLAGEKGLCHAGPVARFFSAQVEVSDELEVVPTFAIALGGCDLRCAFCITGRESWNANSGRKLDLDEVAGRARVALEKGAQSVMILGGEPTIFLPDALEIVSRLPENARLIWKTNGHGSKETRDWLEGVFDVWLVDYKFGNDACARRLARVEDYERVVRENLFWASDHSELIVRHLLMPGHIDCCWEPVARWISRYLPEAKVSLRSGFWPGWRASQHAELTRSCSACEVDRAAAIAKHFSLHLIE